MLIVHVFWLVDFNDQDSFFSPNELKNSARDGINIQTNGNSVGRSSPTDNHPKIIKNRVSTHEAESTLNCHVDPTTACLTSEQNVLASHASSFSSASLTGLSFTGGDHLTVESTTCGPPTKLDVKSVVCLASTHSFLNSGYIFSGFHPNSAPARFAQSYQSPQRLVPPLGSGSCTDNGSGERPPPFVETLHSLLDSSMQSCRAQLNSNVIPVVIPTNIEGLSTCSSDIFSQQWLLNSTPANLSDLPHKQFDNKSQYPSIALKYPVVTSQVRIVEDKLKLLNETHQPGHTGISSDRWLSLRQQPTSSGMQGHATGSTNMAETTFEGEIDSKYSRSSFSSSVKSSQESVVAKRYTTGGRLDVAGYNYRRFNKVGEEVSVKGKTPLTVAQLLEQAEVAQQTHFNAPKIDSVDEVSFAPRSFSRYESVPEYLMPPEHRVARTVQSLPPDRIGKLKADLADDVGLSKIIGRSEASQSLSTSDLSSKSLPFSIGGGGGPGHLTPPFNSMARSSPCKISSAVSPVHCTNNSFGVSHKPTYGLALMSPAYPLNLTESVQKAMSCGSLDASPPSVPTKVPPSACVQQIDNHASSAGDMCSTTSLGLIDTPRAVALSPEAKIQSCPVISVVDLVELPCEVSDKLYFSTLGTAEQKTDMVSDDICENDVVSDKVQLNKMATDNIVNARGEPFELQCASTHSEESMGLVELHEHEYVGDNVVGLETTEIITTPENIPSVSITSVDAAEMEEILKVPKFTYVTPYPPISDHVCEIISGQVCAKCSYVPVEESVIQTAVSCSPATSPLNDDSADMSPEICFATDHSYSRGFTRAEEAEEQNDDSSICLALTDTGERYEITTGSEVQLCEDVSFRKRDVEVENKYTDVVVLVSKDVKLCETSFSSLPIKTVEVQKEDTDVLVSDAEDKKLCETSLSSLPTKPIDASDVETLSVEVETPEVRTGCLETEANFVGDENGAKNDATADLAELSKDLVVLHDEGGLAPTDDVVVQVGEPSIESTTSFLVENIASVLVENKGSVLVVQHEDSALLLDKIASDTLPQLSTESCQPIANASNTPQQLTPHSFPTGLGLFELSPKPADPGDLFPRPVDPGDNVPRPAEPGDNVPRPAEPGDRRPACPGGNISSSKVANLNLLLTTNVDAHVKAVCISDEEPHNQHMELEIVKSEKVMNTSTHNRYVESEIVKSDKVTTASALHVSNGHVIDELSASESLTARVNGDITGTSSSVQNKILSTGMTPVMPPGRVTRRRSQTGNGNSVRVADEKGIESKIESLDVNVGKDKQMRTRSCGRKRNVVETQVFSETPKPVDSRDVQTQSSFVKGDGFVAGQRRSSRAFHRTEAVVEQPKVK